MAKRLTTEIFIERSKQKYGELYDYSESIYKSTHEKVIIICKKHGPFKKAPSKHFSGQGCPTCSKEEQIKNLSMSQEEFISRSRSKHDGYYTYERTKYISGHKEVIITCPIHGDFHQLPSNHLYHGKGCIKCSGTEKKDTKQFIKDAKEEHGDRFTYNKTKYVNNRAKVIITCRIANHGDFEQTPKDHLRGTGCPICGGNQKKTTEIFISEASNEHQGRYTYENANYTGNHDLVIITCPDHGDFEQSAISHLRGHGCSKCRDEFNRINQAMTTEEFIGRSKENQNYEYTYEKVNYVNYRTKVIITCPDHGDFEQLAGNHIKGIGCPTCGKEFATFGMKMEDAYKLDSNLPGKLYVLEMFNDKERFFKVGITKNTVEIRYSSYLPYDYEICLEAPIGLFNAFDEERRLLSLYEKKQYIPDIIFNGYMECLTINPIEHDSYLQDLLSRFPMIEN